MARVNGEVYAGRGDDWEAPVSRAEELLQAHPDIRVLRSEFEQGQVEVTRRIEDRWRQIDVDVEHEKGSQGRYPTVILSAHETPRDVSPYDELSKRIRRYGLMTIVKVHVGEDEYVTPEVGYGERIRYPSDFTRGEVRFYEDYSQPIHAREIVAQARTGLEILKAYGEASLEQRVRVYTNNVNEHWDESTWAVQFYDGEPGREDMDKYLASVSPLWGRVMSQDIRFSITASRIKAMYALNALNKVTDEMLPGEMPPAPGNRREPRRIGTLPAPGRRPAGR